ncbi:hypothetical protein OF83DRAFT_1170745 [Amylostereum chailletii]|nr:hypothetical protein OF83DRAFT_1170745 [Amylostereum chailletii]
MSVPGTTKITLEAFPESRFAITGGHSIDLSDATQTERCLEQFGADPILLLHTRNVTGETYMQRFPAVIPQKCVDPKAMDVLIEKGLPRMGTLVLDWDHHATSPFVKKVLCTHPAPLELQELDITYDFAENPTPFGLFQGNLPASLLRLTLSNCSISRRMSIHAGLCSLTLVSVQVWDSVAHMVNVLERLEGTLEELCLTRAFPPSTTSNRVPATSSTLGSRLKRLLLGGAINDVAAVVPLFSPNKTCSLNLSFWNLLANDNDIDCFKTLLMHWEFLEPMDIFNKLFMTGTVRGHPRYAPLDTMFWLTACNVTPSL